MKNKKLMLSMSLIGLVLLVSFFTEKSKTTEKGKGDDSIKTVGVLQYVSHPALDDIYEGVKVGLSERGYKEGENIKINFQNGQADQSKLATMSQQLLSQGSNVLIGIATPAAQALANSTKETPIILGAVSDPKSANLVADNQRPGGNITGVSDQSPVDAQLDLVKELLPKAKRIGVLFSSAEDNSTYQADRVVSEGQKQGFMVKKYPISSSNDISQMVQVMSQEVDVIYLPTDNVIANATEMIVEIANKNQVPIIPSVETMVAQGGLATVGINQFELGRQTGRMAADVLAGQSDPQTTPIYTFTSGDVIINEEQAGKLGIEVPKEIKEKALKVK